MRFFPFQACLLWLLFTVATACALGPDGPPIPRNLPGEVLGGVQTRWLAPYVLEFSSGAGTNAFRLQGARFVRWLNRDGSIRKELSGQNLTTQPGYAATYDAGVMVLHGFNEDWTLTLTNKAHHDGYAPCTPDSRVLAYQYDPVPGQLAVDIYVMGKRVSSLGPFPKYRGDFIRLADDGCLALLTAPSNAPVADASCIIVAGPDGQLRFQAQCDKPVIFPEVAPGGTGVLVMPNDSSVPSFEFYCPTGKVSSFGVGPNGRFVAWVNDHGKAVFETSVGHDESYRLVDCATAKTLWQATLPHAGYSVGGGIAVHGGCLVISLFEYLDSGGHTVPMRTLYALDLQTGRLLGEWRPNYYFDFKLGRGELLSLSHHLYLIGDEEFSEISLADITQHRNGWTDQPLRLRKPQGESGSKPLQSDAR
jgi:hypothetical protein